jgi:hypothetical protein
VGLERVSDLRELDEHDIAKLALRIIGDADLHDVVLTSGFQILVLGGIAKIGWDGRHEALSMMEGMCSTAEREV